MYGYVNTDSDTMAGVPDFVVQATLRAERLESLARQLDALYNNNKGDNGVANSNAGAGARPNAEHEKELDDMRARLFKAAGAHRQRASLVVQLQRTRTLRRQATLHAQSSVSKDLESSGAGSGA